MQRRDLEPLRRQGVSCVGLYMSERERGKPSTWADLLRDRLLESELRCLYVVGALGNLTTDDEESRRRAVATTATGVVAAAAAGADRLLIGPGGPHPKGPWWFHPSSFLPEARAALVRSLRELAEHAEDAGVGITVEGHQGTVLESPAVMREVLDEVGSPAVGASLDFVNFLTPPLIARFEVALAEMVAALGPRLTALHVKDAVVRPRLAVHIDELAPGDGQLDLRVVLAHARRLAVPAVLEHLTPSRATSAIAHVVRLASE